jgi:hypothetical protein
LKDLIEGAAPVKTVVQTNALLPKVPVEALAAVLTAIVQLAISFALKRRLAKPSTEIAVSFRPSPSM